ncbi:outer membrane protein [Aquipluma nitroreducens]|uniref:Outer membrane protein n=1 Tax=Aquipluma nitroreducens TaxID=2010828 RepID=A0A5K7S4A1_9BACT|nr:RagB/SusD family nutrient uptake outer membrane protein [Aquipluma nitroreducens]BBE16327.1 outer membrane protein [Aquipluma nitroreducens]
MRHKIVIATAILLLGIIGCNEDFLNLENQNSYTEDSYFTTASQLQESVVAAYCGFYQIGLFAREWYFYHDMLGNDAKAAPAMVGTGSMGQLPALSYDGTNSEIQNLWRSLYRIVLRSTIAIDKSNEFTPTTTDETTVKNNTVGEASFLKAWSYFTLYRLWGVIPLRKTIDDMAINDFARAGTEQEVVDYILEVLKDAEADLPVSWSTANKGRVTRGAAIALRGQLYLWQKSYALAEAEFAKLATTPYSYALAPKFSDNNTEAGDNNVESLFEVQHAYNKSGSVWYMFGSQEYGVAQAVTGRAMEYGFNDWFNVYVSNSCVESFKYTINEHSYVDPRAFYTFYGNAASGGDTTYYSATAANNEQSYPFATKGYAWKKYQRYETQEKEGKPCSPINTRVLRYADVLLMRAECMIQTGNTSGALTLINQVRERSGAEKYTSLGSTPMTILKRERRLELSGEQVRFFDLIRWGELVSTLNPEKSAQSEGTPYQEKHNKFPITTDELDINKKMTNSVYYSGWN